MVNDPQSPAARAHEYDQAVREYEEFDRQIDALLSSRGGVSQNLSDVDYAHYRELVGPDEAGEWFNVMPNVSTPQVRVAAA